MATPSLTAQAKALAYPGLTRGTLAHRLARGVDVQRIARAATARGLIFLMAVGSVAIWTLIPLGGLWLASQLTDSYTQLPLGPVLVVGAGMPAAMVLATKALAGLERAYGRLTGTDDRPRVVPAWRRSIRDVDPHLQPSMLEKIMVANVLLAMAGLAVWLFVLAGPSLPA